MTQNKFSFPKVIRIEGDMVTVMMHSGRNFDYFKADFPWDVTVGDKVCLHGGFIHSRVPDGVLPTEYLKALVDTLKG